MNVKNWTKGTTVVISGEALLLTGKPKKATDGSYIVFGIDSSGKVKSCYVNTEGEA